MVESVGIPVQAVAHKIGEGRPDTVDLIKQGQVVAVVNTVTGRRRPLLDGFEIRRAAVENGIPCYTSLDTARAAVLAQQDFQAGTNAYNIQTVAWYRQK
jgi:carbamoyl-phosphate synthase large subunit